MKGGVGGVNVGSQKGNRGDTGEIPDGQGVNAG